MEKVGRKKKSNFHKIGVGKTPQTVQRDSEYTNILTNFRKNQERTNLQRLILKYIFFVLVCLFFGAIVSVSSFILYKSALKIGETSYSDLGIAITGLAGLISSIIILPTTIAENLFPKDGEKEEIALVVSMQNFDTEIAPDETVTNDNINSMVEVSGLTDIAAHLNAEVDDEYDENNQDSTIIKRKRSLKKFFRIPFKRNQKIWYSQTEKGT